MRLKKYSKEFKIVGAVVVAMASAKMLFVSKKADDEFPKFAKEAVKMDRSDADKKTAAVYEECKNAANDIRKVLNENSVMKMNTWKKENDYDSKIADIKRRREAVAARVKQELNYDARVAQIDREKSDSIAAFKKETGWTDDINKIESKISSLKSGWQKDSANFDIMKNMSVSEESKASITEAKATSKKAYDKAMAEAANEKKALEKKLNDFKSQAGNDATRSLNLLNGEYNNLVTNYSKDIDEDANKLEQLRKDAKDKAYSEARSELNDEMVDILNMEGELKPKMEAMRKQEEKLAESLTKDTPSYEKIGKYLNDQGYSKLEVGLIGILPTLPFVYILYRYMSWLGKVIKSM